MVTFEPRKGVKSGPKPKEPLGVRTCTECGEMKPPSAYLPIKACKDGHYGRCRVCRAKRNKQRYYSSPEVLEAERARSRRNMHALRQRRRLKDSTAS